VLAVVNRKKNIKRVAITQTANAIPANAEIIVIAVRRRSAPSAVNGSTIVVVKDVPI